jgi:hypothetical protein
LKKRLPLIFYIIKNFLEKSEFNLTNNNKDGRVNSSSDEDIITDLLEKRFNKYIKVPKSRNWYDILVYDNLFGWLPVNIKTTTFKTSDNTGNLAICVQAYTSFKLDLNTNYQNGQMSKILIEYLKDKNYNKIDKKDYYFLVINKDTKEIVVNSIKGLNSITKNVNNLPFQIKWKNNTEFKYTKIENVIDLFCKCFENQNDSWRDYFIKNIKLIRQKQRFTPY